jgi:6,7-dimethyl-8-ribityllumazine synthase
MKGVTFAKLNGSKLKIAIVKARWNHEITDSLLLRHLISLRDGKLVDVYGIEYVKTQLRILNLFYLAETNKTLRP